MAAVTRVERSQRAARRLLGPLLAAAPGASGWRLLSWDAEQGISLTFERAGRVLLVELEARDEALDCLARTRLFNLCARALLGEPALRPDERALVRGVQRLVEAREGLVALTEGPGPAAEVREIEVDRALVAEGAGRYYLNPYAGCTIGCTFCYAAPRAELSRRLDGAPAPPWGRWVDVKVNAPERLAREVLQHPPGLVRLSPILTDPYQPIEQRYRLTRRCLEVLLGAGFSAVILTREARLLADLDLFTRHRERVAVGFSIPTDREELRAAFEPRSDPLAARWQALAQLAAAGVATCLVVQPLLPLDPRSFAARAAAAGVRAVRIDRMHFAERVAERYAQAGLAADADATRVLHESLRDELARVGVRVDEGDDLAGLLALAP